MEIAFDIPQEPLTEHRLSIGAGWNARDDDRGASAVNIDHKSEHGAAVVRRIACRCVHRREKGACEEIEEGCIDSIFVNAPASEESYELVTALVGVHEAILQLQGETGSRERRTLR